MGQHEVGQNKKGNEAHKYSPGRGPPVDQKCEFCAGTFRIAGPFYNGVIHNSDFLDVILRIVAKSSKTEFASYDRMVGMLSVISEEIQDIPFYYSIPQLNNVLRASTAPQETMMYIF
jgi:tRNA (guanine26-N2/guanine27-N2)-dimethyltransferase